MTIIEQLNKIYFTEEWWQSHKETSAGITNYHQTMLDKGNIVCYLEGGRVLGYYEIWKVNWKQLKLILKNKEFIAPFEDTNGGNICYLANLWIRNDYRKTFVFTVLKRMFNIQTKDCRYFVGNEVNNINRLRFYRRNRWDKKKPVEQLHK